MKNYLFIKSLKFLKYSLEITIGYCVLSSYLGGVNISYNFLEKNNYALLFYLNSHRILANGKNQYCLVLNPFNNKIEDKNLIGFPEEWCKSDMTGIYHKNPQGNVWVESMLKNNEEETLIHTKDSNFMNDSNSWGSIPYFLVKSKVFFVITTYNGRIRFLTNSQIQEIYNKYYDKFKDKKLVFSI